MDHVFQVQGMTCGHCERAVKQSVAQVDPQASTTVDLPTGQVVVHSTSSRETLVQAIQEEGYSVT
ncbi:heavy-metal-associated domain-containing protein [Comamonas aquatica]|uniref:heavy-metal-associated domain-containing protein n=1 Tax=Comamonas aquatica TaxID=225991 RepID=UPI00244C5CE0|nr:heavy-metal-associated domain-containing protein [Comamonas aquatica]MDH0382013.1 heavy-metal-associated domain-containing protein [Comamonas aquatica]MDH0430207.1 heavy-metal-associated domain-containing protein [Comamonas aquatica]MDH0900014.1 heavy-metal-associated domain-containing protein [Comamonas aquatica]MDH0941106.1 heavy-metal-associated domain-containing protein [Comamonas aquatica]